MFKLRRLSFIKSAAVTITLVGLSLASFINSPQPAAGGISHTVNDTQDVTDANLGDGVCDTDLVADGLQCTLRAAVQQANTDNGPDSVQLPGGTYTLTIPGSDDAAAKGDLDIDDDLSIHGAGGPVIQAGETPESGIDRVFDIDPGVSVELTGLTVRHGDAPGERGGGIYNRGTLRLSIVTVASNSAMEGGGIFNESGSVEITDSTLDDNLAEIDGGGMYNESGDASLDSVDVTTNHAGSNGAGINSEGNGASLLVQASTISGNVVDDGFNGGGIDAEGANGSLNVVSSVIADNTTGSNGGGIYVFTGTELTVFGTTVSGNHSDVNGGGIYYGGTGSVSLTDSTIDNNTTGSFGGGVYSWKNATLTNLTISGNEAGSDAGGIFVRAVTTITSSTITGNTADSDENGSGDGGGLQVREEGTALLGKSIVAGNFDPTSDPDCHGIISSQGYNLIHTISPGCQVTGDTTGNITDEDPRLGPLDDNGGPTRTHALLPDSPAIDAVSAGCPPPAADQRGVARPQGPACDMGAYERETGPGLIWGDHNCSGAADPIDALLTLRHDAGLPVNLGDCPDFGDTVPTGGPSLTWGDVDCGGAINPVDALKLLRHDAGLSVTQPAGCPEIGELV